jgi:hypothetical protein
MDKFPRKPSGESFLKINLPIYIVVSGKVMEGKKPRIAKCGAFIFSTRIQPVWHGFFTYGVTLYQ